MGSDAPFTFAPATLATVNPAPDVVPSTNFKLSDEPELATQLFQTSLVVTPVAANPVLLVTEASVKATSIRLPAFDEMIPARKAAVKLRLLKLRIIRSFV